MENELALNRPLRRADFVIAGFLALAAFAGLFRLADWETAPYHRATARDIWFDADIDRVYSAAATRVGDNDRITIHPLYTFVAYPSVAVIGKVFGLSYETAVRVFHSAIGTAWLAVFFLLLRTLRIRRLDSLLFTSVALTSASGLFWLAQVETFALGSLSTFLALFLCAAPASSSIGRWLVASVLGMSITVTNWMVPLFGSFVRLRRREFLVVALCAFGVVMGTASTIKFLFPTTPLLFTQANQEAAWMFAPESGGPWAILRTFFLTSVVAPDISFLTNWRCLAWPMMSMQAGALFSGTGWSRVATPAWALLLGIGFTAFFRTKGQRDFRLVLGLSLLYTLLMHMIYGRETFLYSMHWLPFLVIIAGFGALTKLRPVVLGLAMVLMVANGINNGRQFRWALQYSHRYQALKSVEGETARRLGRTSLPKDPTFRYRFWKEITFRPARTGTGSPGPAGAAVSAPAPASHPRP